MSRNGALLALQRLLGCADENSTIEGVRELREGIFAEAREC